jgi:CO/xanthine dehydrogenase FAD-binding subunit
MAPRDSVSATSPTTPRVFIPDNLQGVFNLFRRHPNAEVVGGGTFLLPRLRLGEATPPPALISIGHIEELRRVTRSDRHLDVGAAAPLSKVLSLGVHILPPAIRDALMDLAPAPVRSLATLGGNLGNPRARMTLFPVLALFGARVELRRGGVSRWVTLQNLYDRNGDKTFDDGELITRVRIPLSDWDKQLHYRDGSWRDRGLVFCGMARLQKNILTELRVAAANHGVSMYRSREMEADLAGRKLPLSSRDRNLAMDHLDNLMSDNGNPFDMIHVHKIRGLVLRLLDLLDEGAS